MPDDDERAKRRARKDASEGKAPSTQAGEFVREEIHHVREGQHGARSPEQAIAIGLSKARRAGVDVPARKGGGRHSARSSSPTDSRGVRRPDASSRSPSPRRARAALRALRREGHRAATPGALGRHAVRAAARRAPAARRAAARRGVRTKGPAGRRAAADRAARTRERTR